MKISVFNTNEFIDINNLKEVTSPVLFERGGTPNPNGLISNEIFGVSIKSRKETFAYISLHGHFFNPHIYKAFKRFYRNIEKIISGDMYVSIDVNGALVKDEENGKTGIKFIYDNWDKIKWERTKGMRNERVDLLTKTPKNEVFMEHQIVIPPFYRDISSDKSGGGRVPEIDNMYSKLIRMCSLINSTEMFDFSFNGTNLSIQNMLVEIYDYFEDKLTGKNGMLRKYLLGKNTIYGVRSVISAPSFHYSKPEDMFIDFEHTGIPISQCCVLVNPFIVYWLRTFFEREFINNKYNKPVYNPQTGKADRYIELKNPEAHFNDQYIKKAIERYIRDPESRFDRIEIPINEPGKKAYMRFTGRYYTGTQDNEEDASTLVSRDLTWTDLLYMACVDMTEDKHALITRYPLLDYFGVFINRVRVSSTMSTVPMIVNGKVYKWYPKIDLSLSKERVSTLFNDTIQFSHAYLPGLDGDYDGDQITIKVLWEKEANEEAERIMYSKNNILNVNGSSTRKIEFEAIQTLYDLTKDTTDKFGYVSNDIKDYVLSLKPEELTFEVLVKILGDIRDNNSNKVSKKINPVHPQDKVKLLKGEFMDNDKVIETTIGKLIYNKLVVERLNLKDVLGYVDWQLTDSGNNKLEGILSSALLNDKMDIQTFFRYIDVRDWLGEQMHFVLTPSFTMGILKTPKKIKDLKEKLIKENREALDNGDVVLAEKIEKQILKAAREELANDPGMDLYDSEARGSFNNNYKNINLLKGPVFNSNTGKYDFVESSYMEGIKKQDIPVYGNAVVQGAYPKAVGTQVSGYFAKKILAALQTEMLDIEGSDCGTKLTLKFKLTAKNARDFYYRYIVENGKLIELTPDVIGNYIGKTVNLRTVMFCANDKKCHKCAGNMFYKLGIENIGLTTSRIATTLTKLGMKRFHDSTVNAEQINPNDIIL